MILEAIVSYTDCRLNTVPNLDIGYGKYRTLSTFERFDHVMTVRISDCASCSMLADTLSLCCNVSSFRVHAPGLPPGVPSLRDGHDDGLLDWPLMRPSRP